MARTSTALLRRPSDSAKDERVELLSVLPFALVHLAALFGVLFVGFSWRGVALCAVLYYLRMFGLAVGYHRYFAHRTFRTSRVGQFLLAVLAATAAQKGPLWWAGHHRNHHRHADTEMDVHSPFQRGFWWAHVGWIFCRDYDATDFDVIKDFAKYPELRWLNTYALLPPFLLAAAMWLAFGWVGLYWGFFLSTVLLWHGTFTVNSLMHLWGRRRYPTPDTSRNNWQLVLVTLGENWHNNHHYYQASAKQGFFWWEIDVGYYGIKVLSWLGLVWDVRTPPKRVLESGRTPDAAEAIEAEGLASREVEDPASVIREERPSAVFR
jgi:stearoyl-CoA desaturase (delta-9 desaturase)